MSTPNVLKLAPAGHAKSDNPWHLREYQASEFEALCRGAFADVEMLGLFHARKLRAHEIALALGWDSVHRRIGITEAFYDRFTPAIATSDFALRTVRLKRGARLPGRVCRRRTGGCARLVAYPSASTSWGNHTRLLDFASPPPGSWADPGG